MTKENPSKKERLENAKRRFSREIDRINKHRKEISDIEKSKEPLPKSLSWLLKRKKKDNGG